MIKIYFDSKYVFRCNVNKMKEPEDSVDEGGEDTSSIPVQGKVLGPYLGDPFVDDLELGSGISCVQAKWHIYPNHESHTNKNLMSDYL